MTFGTSQDKSCRANVPTVSITTKLRSPILGAACVRTKRPMVMPPYRELVIDREEEEVMYVPRNQQ